jgi:hypothetical protein
MYQTNKTNVAMIMQPVITNAPMMLFYKYTPLFGLHNEVYRSLVKCDVLATIAALTVDL